MSFLQCQGRDSLLPSTSAWKLLRPECRPFLRDGGLPASPGAFASLGRCPVQHGRSELPGSPSFPWREKHGHERHHVPGQHWFLVRQPCFCRKKTGTTACGMLRNRRTLHRQMLRVSCRKQEKNNSKPCSKLHWKVERNIIS